MGCAATVPVMVGTPAGSVLITVVAVLGALVGPAELVSLSVKVVVVLPGAPAVGVKTRASKSVLRVLSDAAVRV